MSRCKITVLKKTLHPELAREYCQGEVAPCTNFREGQEFTTNFGKPSGFCDWAWNDIHQYVAVLLAGGNFAGDLFNGWMNDDKTMIACCTDGIRPVVFKIEAVDR